MFTLTETEARLAMYEFGVLTSYTDADTYLSKLRQSPDTFSVDLPTTKSKLHYDADRGSFYIDANQVYNYGKLYIFDSLELLESYWEYLLEVCDFTEQYINYLKAGYLKYKEYNLS